VSKKDRSFPEMSVCTRTQKTCNLIVEFVEQKAASFYVRKLQLLSYTSFYVFAK
jgi:hypothetical protein